MYEVRALNMGNSNTLYGVVAVNACVKNIKAQHDAAAKKAMETFNLKIVKIKLLGLARA